MTRIPATVATYLQDWAPKGHLLGYWLDRHGEYNVLILRREEERYRFSVAGFPQTVGHWGHELAGGEYDSEAMRQFIDRGLWAADEWVKECLRKLIERIERGADIADLLAECRARYDPQGRFDPQPPTDPPAGPKFTNEGHYRVIVALVKALADADREVAEAAAQRLASMGITEDAGPLFAREALMVFRKRKEHATTDP